MSTFTEIDALKAVDDALAQLEDQVARDRVLQWALAKYSTPSLLTSEDTQPPKSSKRQSSSTRKRKAARSSPSIVKDLNLRSEGRQSFNDFAGEKKPATNQEKCVVAVYYLGRVLSVSGISTDHVFTCYKSANWRVPSNLYTTLLGVASHKGWLDTSDMNNVMLTSHGENLVEHDLPKKPVTGDSQ